MSEGQKAVVGAVIIVACLALLGVMAVQKIDGASVAAIAAVTTIVAWLTRSPDRKDPPAGGAAVILVGIGVATLAALVSCKEPIIPGAMSPEETAYTAALLRCVDQSHTLAESRACRERVDREWGIVSVTSDAGKDGAP